MESCRILLTCPRCEKRKAMELTSWQPGPGLDPRMREFHCSFCDFDFYKVVTEYLFDKILEAEAS